MIFSQIIYGLTIIISITAKAFFIRPFSALIIQPSSMTIFLRILEIFAAFTMVIMVYILHED